MHKNRISSREQCYSKIWLIDADIPAYLIDISKTGVKIEIFQELLLKKEDVINIRIIPHSDIRIAPFEAAIKIKWVQTGEDITVIGSEIVPSDSETERNFQKINGYYNNSGQ